MQYIYIVIYLWRKQGDPATHSQQKIMSIIIIYLTGCFLSYMRVNAFESKWNERKFPRDVVFFAFMTMMSWIGFLTGSVLFIIEREKGEKFFKL